MTNKTPIMNREVCQFIQAKADGKGEGTLWFLDELQEDIVAAKLSAETNI